MFFLLESPSLLDDPALAAVYWPDQYDAVADALVNIKNNGVGAARLGNATGGDSNDPRRLLYTGSVYVNLPGTAANYVSCPDAATLDITGDISLRARIAPDDWSPSAQQNIMAKWTSVTNNRSFFFSINTSGSLQLALSNDGNNAVQNASSTATGFADGTAHWVRVDWRASDGRTQFFVSEDGVAWSQLGTNITVNAVSIFSGAAVVELGSVAVGTAQSFAGKIHYADIRNNILNDGSGIVAKFDASLCGQTGYTDSLNSTVWTVNRATSGRKSAVVDRNMMVLGPDDYLEIADNALLDFGQTDSFTIAIATRQFATPGNNGRYAAKIGDAGAGYQIRTSGTNFTVLGSVSDGTNSPTNSLAFTQNAAQLLSLVVNGPADNIASAVNDTINTPTTNTITGTMENALPLRIGRPSETSTAYQDFEFFGFAVFRRALNSAELKQLRSILNAM